MRLFVASYAGTVTTLELSSSAQRGFSFEVIASTRACCPKPSWITLDPERNVLYCTEPGVNGAVKAANGTLHTFYIQPDGSLVPRGSTSTPVGAAYSALYSNNQALGVAY